MARNGLLISVDGPAGAGKTTTVRHLARLLTQAGLPIHSTAQPSGGPVGQLARSLVDSADGHTLACLFAADRYQHLQTEIRPRLAAGDIVLCDRYLASGLSVQRHDGLDLPFLAGLNRDADPPDLAIILTADPHLIRERITGRGVARNRYQTSTGLTVAELGFYTQAAGHLCAIGIPVQHVDTGTSPALSIATELAATVGALHDARRSLMGQAS